MKFHLLLMTSRSGSSMVADIFVRHGFYWAKNENRNPLVGGKKVRYHSFENQAVKDYLKSQFGVPLGDLITYDDTHANQFAALLRNEYQGEKPNVWKGAIEFWPIWLEMFRLGVIYNMQVSIIYRDKEKVIESVLAKRQGRGDENEARRITDKRYELMHDMMSEYAIPAIYTDELIAGKYDSIEEAMSQTQGDLFPRFDPEIARAVINPQKWETDR